MSKTEREMLELAGVAAGMHVLRDREVWPDEQVGGFFCQVGDNVPALYDRATNANTKWQPLTDDGDCARLEAALGISISWKFTDRVYAEKGSNGFWSVEYFKDHPNDKQAARRMASLRVAAAIGEAMQ